MAHAPAWIGWYRVMGCRWLAEVKSSVITAQGLADCTRHMEQVMNRKYATNGKPISWVVLPCPETPTSGGLLK